MMKPIKVLVVDDSVFIRVSISRLLETDPDITVMDFAKDGREAVEKVKKLHPDVVTMDVIMPVMDGLTALKRIIKEAPTPVVMLSSITRRGARETIAALAYGAIDFIPKPLDLMRPGAINKIRQELISKVKVAAVSRINAISDQPISEQMRQAIRLGTSKAMEAPALKYEAAGRGVVAIGASTGGPSALQLILSALPKNFPLGIVAVQHIAVGFTDALVARLNNYCALQVKVAGDIEALTPGTVLFAKSGKHLKIKDFNGNLVTYYSEEPADAPALPSIDVLFKSVAQNCQADSCGVILTGMGTDGAAGLKAIKDSGGLALAQDEATSVIFGMAANAVELGAVDRLLPLQKLSTEIIAFASRYHKRKKAI